MCVSRSLSRGRAGGLEKQNEIERKAKIMGIVLTKLMTQLSSYSMSSVNYYNLQ